MFYKVYRLQELVTVLSLGVLENSVGRWVLCYVPGSRMQLTPFLLGQIATVSIVWVMSCCNAWTVMCCDDVVKECGRVWKCTAFIEFIRTSIRAFLLCTWYSTHLSRTLVTCVFSLFGILVLGKTKYLALNPSLQDQLSCFGISVLHMWCLSWYSVYTRKKKFWIIQEYKAK